MTYKPLKRKKKVPKQPRRDPGAKIKKQVSKTYPEYDFPERITGCGGKDYFTP